MGLINLSHFRYASTKVGFGSAGTTAASTAKDASSKVSSLMSTAASGASSSSPFESAAQSNISDGATLAVQAAMARINKTKKAQSEALIKQIDATQTQVNQAQVEAQLKQKYYVYTLPAVIVDTTDTTGTTTDTTA